MAIREADLRSGELKWLVTWPEQPPEARYSSPHFLNCQAVVR